MRVKGATIQHILLGLALLAGVIWSVARAGEIKELRLSTGPTGTRVDIQVDRETKYQVLSLAGPDRLVLDLPDTAIGVRVALPAGKGLIQAVRTGQPEPGTTRIVFDLASPVVALKPRFEQGEGGPRLVVEWPGDGATATASTPIAATTPAKSGTDSADPARQAADVLTADAPQADPTIASSQATSRLIASLPAAAPAQSPEPASANPASVSPSAGAGRTGTAQVRQSSATIATGVPTRIATGTPVSPSPPASASTATTAPVRTMRDVARRGGLRPLVIAIDAGHGGQDPGAIGAGGTREKDLTLQVAKELARQVNKSPGLRAYLTRDADYFIPLAQRYQKARAQKADLFVSIHADAFTNPSASGSSVFVLSQRGASSQAAKWLANQENAADLVGGVRLQGKDNTLASVLLDLSQSATMKASEDMANHVLSGLKRLGKTHKHHVERANFVVLRAPDVPSMLVETAFITNPQEERRLRDPAHQRRLATAILDGVNTYFTRQPPPGTLYAARAEAGIGQEGGSP